MLIRKINAVPVGIKSTLLKGFSLFEMLIALTLGSFLLFIFFHFYSEFHRLQTQQKTQLFLQKEAHQFANYLQQHIQHMGYQGENRQADNFSLFEQNGKRYALPSPQCLIFFYDLNNDGCLGKRATKKAACTIGEMNNSKELAKEIFGFKLEKGEIYLYAENKLENCIGKQCQSLFNSCSERWTKFTSIQDFYVDKLHFSWKKPEVLLQLDLKLSSVKEKHINYQLTAYIHLLNTL